MKNKLQVFDMIQIFGGLFLGLGSKILDSITGGSVIFTVVNIIGLLAFVQGIINFLEDKYSIKIINLTRIDYSK